MEYKQFFEYQKAVEKDLTFDDFNLTEVVKQLPSKKHFWVGRLVEAKINLKKLEDSKRDAIKHVQNKIKAEVGLSQSSISKMLNNHEEIQKIDDRIEELKLIIEYLERVEKIFSQASFDLKNYIEVIKMELT